MDLPVFRILFNSFLCVFESYHFANISLRSMSVAGLISLWG
jgi:hypothetical protein